MKQNKLLNEIKLNIYKKIIISIILAIVLQLCLIYIFELSYFDILSFFQNWLLILYISFFNTDSNFKHFILILIIVFLIIDFFILKRYLGQTLILLPFTSVGHLSINMQKIQNYNSFKYHLNSTLIDFKKQKPNFWYEYHNFKHFEEYFWLLITTPGKYDSFINIKLYSINFESFKKKIIYDELINKNEYNVKKNKKSQIVYITNLNFYYYYEVNFIDKTTLLIVKTQNYNINIKSKFLITDNYCAVSNIKYYFPSIPKYFIRFGGISDIYPYEILNDVALVSNSDASINGNLDTNSFSWFDRYIGNGYYYMTNYIWTMHYSKNWNIFILFYTDFPYKDGVCVTYFFNKKTNTMIEISNFYPYENYNLPLTGTQCKINTFGSRLTDNYLNFEIKYKSPKINCSISNKKNIKVLDNMAFYKRNDNLDKYGDGEELHKITEELVYNEFFGHSHISLNYNNIEYNEECITVIDGIDWENGKNGPNCYENRETPFFQNKFFIQSKYKDLLNLKKPNCI
jgi:hypothetical protein